MKTLSTVLTCLGLFCAASSSAAQVTHEEGTKVHVAAGDLADGVEALGKQAGVNVLYPGDLLEGRSTPGVDGTLSPAEAFARLLQGTALTLIEERGAIRIAMAPPEPVASSAAPRVDSAPVMANWIEHDLRIRCSGCDRSSGVVRLLERMGATGVSAKRTRATFVALAPAGEGEIAAQVATAARWQTMTFDVAELNPSLVQSFTMRNPRASEGRIAVDVLVADSALEAPECHRVSEQDGFRRYCGSADQWKDLRASVGFRCSDRHSDVGVVEGLRYETCASAAQWSRVSLAQTKERPGYSPIGDGFWFSALGSFSPPDNSQVPVSGPLPQTPPPPAH